MAKVARQARLRHDGVMLGRFGVLASLVVLGPGIGCTGHDGSDRGVEPVASPVEQLTREAENVEAAPVIVTLQTREHVISIHADGPRGREYSIAALDGRVLASRITFLELRRDFPQLEDAVESAIADLDCGAPGCPVLDARASQVLDAGL